ncbi:hypothetical protein C5L28_001653 [Lentilactobacillus parakefiri]|uniref:Uncharacterized protein n=1 Tax=Lentilactobacillus parakefiri TaxID=152332 RepID=A0A224VGV6_9LACO|nr:hypothetical protein C5L28_001653 [Lentilactobacillus parakefiri]GAW71782.1 hypothetical protein LPKJCM_00885 [Lentilactobacillus parakefiri]
MVSAAPDGWLGLVGFGRVSAGCACVLLLSSGNVLRRPAESLPSLLGDDPDPYRVRQKVQTMNKTRSSFKFPPYTPGSTRVSSHSG